MGLHLTEVPDRGWEQSIAAVVDSSDVVRGTAFFVGLDVAVTCNHVLEAAERRSLRLRSVGSQLEEPVIGADRDEEHDLALLRVAPRSDRRFMQFDPKPQADGLTIVSRGFPKDRRKDVYPDGYPMRPALISGTTRVKFKGREIDAFVLVGADVTKGMSGAPAVDLESGAVVGVLSILEWQKKDVFAIPVSIVVERWPGLFVISGAQPPSFEYVVPTVPEMMAKGAWDTFDPNALHCVVVGSELLAAAAGREQLPTLVRKVLADHEAGSAIWTSFVGARQGATLVDGSRRELSLTYSVGNVKLAAFTVIDSFTNKASLDLAIRLLVEADLVLFDVTGFEPGVMLLLGVRAATRRGVSVTSHGGGWEEGVWTRGDRPFNLSDLALSSHTPSETLVGADPRVDRFAERVRTGFEQLARQPFYRDLPVYDALRQLGSAHDAWNTIPLDQEVLVLCSYAETYFHTWRDVLNQQLKDALFEMGMSTNVYRLQDVPTPQVVSQSLYERIRRCAGCVADWTGSSPSTFFELGVRMTVSPWSVVQIVSEDWLQTKKAGGAEQINLMRQLLDPMTYRDNGDDNIGRRIADRLLQLRSQIVGSAGHQVRRVASVALGRVEERLLDLHDQLRTDADALSNTDVDQDIPQSLFYEVRDIKMDRERSALERRLAAWLYLEHRLDAGRLDMSDPRWARWRNLGIAVAVDLYAADAEADRVLADSISERIAQEAEREVQLLRCRGDALVRSGRVDEAMMAYRDALAVVEDWLAAPFAEEHIPAEMANLLGIKGGLHRRLGEVDQALGSYRRGAEIETTQDLLGTYNRANVIKLALIADEHTLADLRDELLDLRRALERRFATDERATDDAWLWADLGDVRLLLGDDAQATAAYRTFADKARSTSPVSTLSVIKECAAAMLAHDDPAGERVASSVAAVEQVLSG